MSSSNKKFDVSSFLKKIESMSADELQDVLKSVSPYNNPNVKEDPVFVNMSILNVREKYMERLLTVSLIGYMYDRAQKFEGTDNEKAAVMRFCNECFRFNPDKHFEDVASEKIKTGDAIVTLSDEEEEKIREDAIPKTAEEKAQIVYAALNQLKNDTVRLCKHAESGDHEKMQLASHAIRERVNDQIRALGKIVSPGVRQLGGLENHIIPGEIFHNFERYYHYNYESLKRITESVYPERSDIEFAVRVYQAFDDEQKAAEHRRVHQEDFAFDVFTVSNGGTTILGPFKNNRDKVDFYNKHNEVLQKIVNQAEKDSKTGQNIMMRRAANDKKKDIEKFGPDPKGLEEWKELSGIINDLGRKTAALTDEEKQKLAEAREKRELLELNKDENTISVHRQNEKGELETEYVRTKVSDEDQTYARMQ